MYFDPNRVLFNSFEIIIFYTIRQVFVLLPEGQGQQEPHPVLTRSIQNGSGSLA